MRSSLWVLTAEYEPYTIGGLGTVATHLTRALAKQGLHVTVISLTPLEKATDKANGNIRIIRIPSSFSSGKILSYIAKKKLGPPGMIHIHSLEFTDLALHYRKRWNIPCIYTLHSVVTRNRPHRIYSRSTQRRLLRSADKIVVPSKWEKEAVVKAFPFCAGKVSVIPHGVLIGKGTSRASKFRLLYAGRLIPKKGIRALIDAIKILRRKYPKVRLYIIGKNTTIMAKIYRMRVRKKRLADRVHWLGFYPHRKLLRAYKHFGAVVVPSRTESFGLTALEALANGVPLVATRAGGLRQFVRPQVAQIIPKVTAPSIAASIEAMWNSPQTTKRRVLAGKQAARAYSWAKAARRYMKLLRTRGV